MAKVKIIKPETLKALKQTYLALGEAYQALSSQERYMQEVLRLRTTVKDQEKKISELHQLITAYQRASGVKMITCPECFGAGAYLVGGEPNECDQCDGSGVIETKA